MQYGTSTEEAANPAPKMRRLRVVTTTLRKAKLAPRRTMPRAAIISGTNSVSVIEAYASGNDVHRMTKMKINQTWLASHTGPIECSNPGVRRDHRHAAEYPGHDDDAASRNASRIRCSPAEDVDGHEDRLGEEEEALEGERHPERSPNWPRPRPQQTELEGSTVPVTAPTAKVTAMYFDQRRASRSAAGSWCLRPVLAISAMNAQTRRTAPG